MNGNEIRYEIRGASYLDAGASQIVKYTRRGSRLVTSVGSDDELRALRDAIDSHLREQEEAAELPSLHPHPEVHLKLTQQGGDMHLLNHLSDWQGHHASATLDRRDLAGRTMDDLLRKHEELHGVTED